jgi:hypothetical protein
MPRNANEMPGYTAPPNAGSNGPLDDADRSPQLGDFLSDVDEGPSADERFARITREQYNYAQKRFDPVLEDMLAKIDDPRFYADRIDMASQGVARAFDVAEGVQGRTLERYGVEVTPQMRRSLDRASDLSEGLAEVGARNNARTELADLREQTRMGLIGIGRETSRQAQGLASGIAAREAKRNAVNNQINAQEDAAEMSSIGTLVGLGIMAFSSRDYKDIDGPVDHDALARELEGLMLQRFRYVEGMNLPGEYVGLIAEDTPEVFRGPDGKTVNLYNLVSALIAANQQRGEAIRALTRRIELLESEVTDGR